MSTSNSQALRRWPYLEREPLTVAIVMKQNTSKCEHPDIWRVLNTIIYDLLREKESLETQRWSGKACWYQRQRPGQYVYKPRNLQGCQQTSQELEKRHGGENSLTVWEADSLADILISDFWITQLWRNSCCWSFVMEGTEDIHCHECKAWLPLN